MLSDDSLAILFKSSTKVFGKSTAEVTRRKPNIIKGLRLFIFCSVLVGNKIGNKIKAL